MRWVFLGPPGAGKGTQAKRIAGERALAHISTGDLLRREVETKTDLGRKAQEFMDRGELVPDSVVIDMVIRRIAGLSEYLLDGFPRTLAQAKSMESKIGAPRIEKVFQFELGDDEVVKRLGGRRTCTKCGTMFHVDFIPPKVAGVCDRCGGSLIQREDDRPQTILHRTKVSREQAGPVLDYYRRRGMLVSIDASKSPDEVARDLRGHVCN